MKVIEKDGFTALYEDFPYDHEGGEVFEDNYDTGTKNFIIKNVFGNEILSKQLVLDETNFAKELPRLYAMKFQGNDYCRTPYNIVWREGEDEKTNLGLCYEIPEGTLTDLVKEPFFSGKNGEHNRLKMAIHVFSNLVAITDFLLSNGVYPADIQPKNIVYRTLGRKSSGLPDLEFSLANTTKSFLGPIIKRYGEENYTDLISLSPSNYVPPESKAYGYYDTDSIFYAIAFTCFAFIVSKADILREVAKTGRPKIYVPPDGLLETEEDFFEMICKIISTDKQDRKNYYPRVGSGGSNMTYVIHEKLVTPPPKTTFYNFSGFLPRMFQQADKEYPQVSLIRNRPSRPSIQNVVRRLRDYHVANRGGPTFEEDWIRIENMLLLCCQSIDYRVFEVRGPQGKNVYRNNNLLHFVRSVDCLARYLVEGEMDYPLVDDIVVLIGIAMYKVVPFEFDRRTIPRLLERMALLNFNLFDPEVSDFSFCFQNQGNFNLFEVKDIIVANRMDVFTSADQGFTTLFQRFGDQYLKDCGEINGHNSAFDPIFFRLA